MSPLARRLEQELVDAARVQGCEPRKNSDGAWVVYSRPADDDFYVFRQSGITINLSHLAAELAISLEAKQFA